MLISVPEFFEGGRSICHNPSLQKMFMYLGGGERAGSGADTILRGWTDNQWCRPSIIENHANDLVCLTLQTESLFAMAHAENECRRAGATPQEKGKTTPQEKGKGTETISAKQNSIEKLILDFCVEPKNTAEIAELLGIKDQKFVRKKYLAPLIGISLELTHPDVPRHRNQKYRTIKP